MNEFDLIRRFFRRNNAARDDVSLGVGDDAALLRPPAGHELAVTTDTLVEDVHFPANAPADAIGYRALATNLSDLAAMGAKPLWAVLALVLPEADESWLEGFSTGFFQLAEAFDVALVGGDVTRGARTVTVTVHGIVPCGQALRRDGAGEGDHVFITGQAGAGAAGLAAYRRDQRGGRYLYPRPRIDEGQALRTIASAAIDISDGLLADLGHIVEASGVGAELWLDRLPIASGADRDMALTGGDDYELCFTVPPAHRAALTARWQTGWPALAEIGRIDATGGIRCRNARGELIQPRALGYQHF